MYFLTLFTTEILMVLPVTTFPFFTAITTIIIIANFIITITFYVAITFITYRHLNSFVQHLSIALAKNTLASHQQQ